MNIHQLLIELNAHDISASLEGDDLLLNFDGEEIPGSLIDEIKSNKSDLITYLKKYGDQEKVTDIQPVSIQESYPLSYAQRRIWILSQYPEVSKAYVIPHQINLSQELNLDAFKKALNAVIDRHEILRTVFKEDENGDIRQWILSETDLNFEISFLDVSQHTNSTELADKYVEEDGFKEFDLERGPLLRASLIKLSASTYRFYYIMHHIISDGWSFEVLGNDVLKYYEAYKRNAEPNITPLKIQYKDYTSWQASQLNSERNDIHKKYWRNIFKDNIPVIEIPSEKQRPQIKTNNGEVVELYFSKETTHKLKRFTREHQGSMFLTLFSVWNILLHRYTHQNEIVLGTAVAGRDHVYLEDQIGFYVNTLALKNNISPNETFTELYEKIKINSLEAFLHQTYPFDLLVEDLAIPRDNSRSPLFDVMYTYQSAASAYQEDFVLEDEIIDALYFRGKRNAKFDIEINTIEIGDYLRFTINYNTDIYNPEIVKQILKHFKVLSNVVVDNPNQKVGELVFLSSEEQHKLLVKFNDTDNEYPSDKTIIQLFEAQVEKHPNRIAVMSDKESLTFIQLNRIANQLGHYLRDQHNISTDHLVGIELSRSSALIVAIFGVLKAGGAYVPIDPNNPEERKYYIKTDANCTCVIDEDFMAQFREIADVYPDRNPENINDASALVYVIYTSGSTGNPKGVMVENHALLNRLIWMQKAYTLREEDVILQKTTYSFDVSVWELLWWSIFGSKVYLLEPDGEKIPAKIVQSVQSGKVTVMHFVPSMLSSFLIYLKQFPEEKIKLSSLKQVFTSGEALSKDHRDLFFEELPRVPLMNLYGPTEASIDVTYYDCSKERTDSLIPIGKPIDNTQIYILDDRNQLVPVGVKGKLYIAGAGLARGYLNKATLTTEKFVANSFKPDKLMYDTGDIAQWLNDGNINFLGRVDDQVKIRGFRIELGEIEHHLRAKEDIDEAVVLVKESAAGQKDLIAFIVSKQEQQVLELRNYLADKIPQYMVPAYFFQIDRIPLNASGKANKKELLTSGQVELSNKVDYVAPKNEKEKVLINVCEDVLNKKKISVKESFYALGGDSIKSIQMVSRLKQMGYALKVEEVLRTPVLEKLAGLLIPNSHKADQAIISGEVALTPIQHYLFDNFSHPHHFNQSILLKSQVPVNLKVLNQCLTEILRHHDALRMCFSRQDGHWKQFNNDTQIINFTIESHDLTGSTNALDSMSSLAGNLQASFDLANAPLMKVGHFILKDGDRLVIIIHHLVVDGISWRILIEDLITLYKQGLRNETLKLPLKTDSFQRWALLQKEYAHSDKIVQQVDYWTTICKKKIPTIKTDHKPQVKVSLNQKLTFCLDEKVTELLQTKFHKTYNTKINDVLLTGLGLAIKETLGQEQTLIKMEGHGREEIIEHIDTSRTLGWFTTVYPVVLDLTETITPVDSLIKVKENFRKIPVNGIGFGMLKYLNKAYNDLTFPASVVFNYLGDFDSTFAGENNSEFNYSSESVGENIAHENIEDVLLHVSGSIASRKLNMSIMYSRSVYREETIHKLINAYKRQLTDLIEHVSHENNASKTPSDLSFKELTIKELNAVNADHTVEDIYELSPLQQGIYFHWLTSTSRSLYFEQISYRLHVNDIQVNVIRRAFQKLVERHPVLRTSFINYLSDIPLQVVRKEVEDNFQYDRLPLSLEEKDIENYVKQYKLKDRDEGFDLSDHSLMRLKVLNLGGNRFEFVWSHHHILMDGWCMRILIQDFNLILNSISHNVPVNIPAPKPYSDYIHWLKSINNQKSLSYWQKYLSDYTHTAAVPFIKVKHPKIYKESVKSIKLEGALFSQMQALCNAAAITQSTFLQTIWGLLLSKYNNTNDVVFGAVVSGRPAALNDVENMVGLFINTIPVRVKFHDDTTPSVLLATMQQEAISSNAHHYQSLAKVQSQSELGADLINHIMVFENLPIKKALKGSVIASSADGNNKQGLSIESVEVFEQTNYDFNILILPSEAFLQVDFKFNTEKFEETFIEKLTRQFYRLIDQTIIGIDKPISEINYILPEEREKITEFNATEIIYEGDKTILDLYKERVLEYPESIAVSYDGITLNYKELDAVTSQLAKYLEANAGVQANDLVGIKLERSEKMLVSVLGILKSGAAYVPLDTNYPEARLAYIKSDSSYKVCIDELFLETFEKEKDNFKRTVEGARVSNNNIAYAIYTSGSTGNPKGVLNDHGGLYNRLLWMRDDLGINSEDVILQKTPYTFDVSVWELLMPCITGCKLVFAKPEGHKDPLYLQELIEENSISIVHFVPSMLGIFLEGLDVSRCKSLKHVICSGEALPAVLVEEFKEKLPWVRIHNLYGPTEAAIDVTSIELTDVDTSESGVTIGKPVANTKLYIVDKHMSLQPIGVPGELLIEGVQVARGYLNRPELTAEKFIASPFHSGARVYRTGDLAKWLSNGEIAYIGRIDNQVKIRGNRIELGEIETRLLQSGYVANAVVVVKGETSLRKFLVAYVIPKEGYRQELLYAHLKTQLPDYMLPSLVIEMESFPITSNGKLNRKALPEAEGGEFGLSSYVAPGNEMEDSLASIWKEVLELDRVGIHDNFFRIGGDSIMAIRLISKINKKFDVVITIAQLYEFNTIAGLCDLLKKGISRGENRRKDINEIEEKINKLRARVLKEIRNPENIEDIYPMSDIQKGMVILSALNPEAGVYHDQFVFQIPTINLDLFKQAFTKLIWKHESLRTRFDLSTYGEEIQIVEKDIDFVLTHQNIQQLDTAEQEDFIKAFMVSERRNPFKVESGLLWRITLFDISQTSMIFLFQFHHAILDGWSIASLNTELFKIYNQLEGASDIKLEKLKSTYKDAVIEELYEKNNSDTIGFWKDELADYKRLDIFRNEPENQILTKVYHFDFKYKLERRCEADAVSVKAVLYAAFVYVLKMMNYEEDFVIGTVTNNRPIVEDGDKILGCFLNTIPVRNRLDEFHDSTWREYFKNSEERLTRLKTKEGLTLYAISKLLNEETIEGSPFFDVLYNYVDFHIYNELKLENDGKSGNSREQNLIIESFETTNTGLDLNVNLTGNALTLGYKLKRGLKFNIPLIKIHQCIDQILSLYIDSPDVRMKDTSLLSYEEREKITEFNATEIIYEGDKTILDLYKERVLEYPESIAVSYDGITLNYKELDAVTSQLAKYLEVNAGVQANDLVGIKLERSEKMLVSVLGILKSGAAYVPVDTNYPEARLAYIKSDSSYKVCIDELFLETFEKERDNFKRTVEGARVSNNNIAYAIYTSGSTGNPKGVLNDHGGLYNRLLWMRDDLGINSEDVILQKTPYTFDVSVWELLMPCITGCKLVFAKPEGHKDPLYLQELIEENSISIVHFVPSMLGIFLEGLDVSRCKSLKHVICSGEALPAVLVEEFKEKLSWVRIHNLYGPTEAAIDVTSIELTDVDTSQSGVTIGKPVANTKLYIVDKHMSLQPIGVPGELLIEGVQVARGYLNRPELTAEKFIASPFHSGARVYRTGDLAKWLSNGEIAYIGRIDNQVKIRGNRIELGEIETRLLQSGYVANAVVVVKGETSLRKFLVAYVIPKEGYRQELLYAHLKTQLPDYMLPSLVIEMESFPITSNGKLNRKALPEAEGGEFGLSSYVAPGNEMEDSLASIWKEVLELDRVGIHDNFFRIGGDSIMAIRLISKINKKFDVVITIAQLYEFNTIAGLVDQILNNTTSFEESRKVRADIRMSFDSLMDEVLGNK